MSITGERTLPQWARVAAPVAVGLMGLALWMVYTVVLEAAPRMLPDPVSIGADMIEHWGIIWADLTVTATNALVGLLVGTVAAIVLGGLASGLRPVDNMTAPLVAALAVVPIVAITPVLNTMFGASSQFGRQAVAALAAFIPVFVNVLRGLHQTRAVHRDVFRASGATSEQTFRLLTFPTALPYLTTGVRLASSLAVISALVAEYFGGPAEGIGTAIATYAKSGRATLTWAYVGGAILIGLAFFLVAALLERLASRRSSA